MSRSVINAKGLPQTSTNREGSSILSPVLGRLLSGACILYVISLKQQEIGGTYWLAQTISLNGSKPNPWLTSGMWMLRSLSRRTSLLDLGSLIPSSQTLAFNSTANLSGDTVVILELQTSIPLNFIPREMDRSRLLTRSQ